MSVPRCQVIPLAEHQMQFLIDGEERTRWHFGVEHPRPFFFPLIGPSGVSLTRMGHPGAPNHDHHRSIWFAHAKVLGMDFWSDTTGTQVRQKEWLAIKDGDDEAILAVRLGWYDGHDPRDLMMQQVVAAIRPGAERELFLELQTTFTPIANKLELAQTNFGFLAVRVASTISAYFGGGQLTNSEGARGEANIFGKPSHWMDYSGPVKSTDEGDVIDGITLFDHSANAGQPTRWHVREDGWMGPSVCRTEPVMTTRDAPLTLRYLLHAHAGDVDLDRAASISTAFDGSPAFVVRRADKPHTLHEIVRM